MVQLTFEQHEFELSRSTYTWMFFNKYIGKFFEDVQQFEKHFIFSRLLYCKNKVYNMYNIQNMC